MDFRGGGLFCISLMLALGLFRLDGHAMTKHTISRKIEGLGAYYPGNDFGKQLSLNVNTYARHEWHGVAGTVKVSTYRSPTISGTEGSMLFLVPTVKSGFNYVDALDVYFSNVGSFQGRSLDARMHFDSIKFGPYTPNGKYNVSYDSNPAGVFLLQPYHSPEMFFGRSDQEQWFPGFEQRYDAVKDFQITITVTYADTGEVCPIPFYQYASDLDDNNVWNTYGAQEGVTFGNGFTDDLYVYDGFRCSVNGRTVKVPNDGRNHNYSDFYMPPPSPSATAGEHASDDPRVGEAGWFMNACWGVTTGGQFTVTFHGSNAVADMNIRSPYLKKCAFTTPKKHGSVGTSDKSQLVWTITQSMPSLEDEVLAPLKRLVIEDPITGPQTYRSCKVLDYEGNDISGQADISFSGGKLTVSMKPSYLSNRSNYGKSFSVKVYCEFQNGADTAENTCTVTLDPPIPPIPSPPAIVEPPSYDGVAMDMYKEVLNEKESYGPGDIVEFLVFIDTTSYRGTHRKASQLASYVEHLKYVPSSNDYYFVRSDGWGGSDDSGASIYNLNIYSNVIADFNFRDPMPNGLELVSEPQMVDLQFSNVRVPDNFEVTPQELYYYDNIIGRAFRRNGNLFSDGDVVDGDGKMQHRFLAENIAKGNKLLYPMHEFFVDKDSYNRRIDPSYYPSAYHYVPPIHPESRDAILNSGWDTSWNSAGISMKAKNDTIMDGYDISVFANHIFNNWHAPLSIHNTTPEAFRNQVYNFRQQNATYLGQNFECHYLAIYYKCRVTGSVMNRDIVNTSYLSFSNAAYLNGNIPLRKNLDFAGSQADADLSPEYFAVVDRIPLSAQASATIHVGGYNITTEVVNGKIDDSVYDLDPGSNVDIGYRPRGGYYLSSIEVDGTPVSVIGNPDLYRFQNIRSSHHIKVVYEKGYNITTSVDNGMIDEGVFGIRPGGSASIHYKPNKGYILESIAVDGVLQNINSWPDTYPFTNVQADHHIHVKFKPGIYHVRYDPNGSSNPDHLTGESVQNMVTGTMADSDFHWYVKGTLRPNAFVRSGYTFIGWNTKADGTGAAYGESPYDLDGKYYSDGYANVLNMAPGDTTVTLYAQWRKKLGTEVLTVVSEETGNPVAGVQFKLYKNVNGSFTEIPGIGTKTTDGNGRISVGDLHWFAYEWRCTSVPAGYVTLPDTGFAVTHSHLDWSHRLVLYLKRHRIILHARVSDIIKGERAPSFLYRVSGTDAAGVNHNYVMEVAVDGSLKTGTSKALSVYAGNYSVTQVPVSRYRALAAENVLHGTVQGINGMVDVLNYDRGELRFPYALNQYGGFGSMEHADNTFHTNTIEIRSPYRTLWLP